MARPIFISYHPPSIDPFTVWLIDERKRLLTILRKRADASRQYRELEARLAETRERHGGDESAEEDAVLDAMDEVWDRMTEAERALA